MFPNGPPRAVSSCFSLAVMAVPGCVHPRLPAGGPCQTREGVSRPCLASPAAGPGHCFLHRLHWRQSTQMLNPHNVPRKADPVSQEGELSPGEQGCLKCCVVFPTGSFPGCKADPPFHPSDCHLTAASIEGPDKCPVSEPSTKTWWGFYSFFL